MGALEAIHYVKGIVLISQHLLQPFITTSGLWLIQENLKDTVFIEESHYSPALLKKQIYF